MIKLYKKAMDGVKKLGFWDWAVLKIYLVVIGLLLATVIPVLTEVNWMIYAGIAIVTGTYTVIKIFKKK
ncbi:MAG: hypothetical protein PHR61_00240 [Candidatus Absconditabacteria bacterium]|nr:hypothetical protein [Candidatus Absconditabacteria bacterium]